MRQAPLPELRERTAGEILDASIKVWGANIGLLAATAGMLLLPFQLLGAWVLDLMRPTMFDEITRVRDLAAEGVSSKISITSRMAFGVLADFAIGSLGWVLVAATAAFFVGELYAASSTRAAAGLIPATNASARSKAGPRALLGVVLRRSHFILGTQIAVAVITLLIGMAVILPIGLLGALTGLSGLAAASSVAGSTAMAVGYLLLRCGTPALMCEATGVIGTLKRSVFLARKKRRSVVGVSLMLSILTSIPNQIITEIVRAALTALGGNNSGFDVLWSGIARSVGGALCTPIAAIGAVYLYFSLRLRNGESLLPGDPPTQ